MKDIVWTCDEDEVVVPLGVDGVQTSDGGLGVACAGEGYYGVRVGRSFADVDGAERGGGHQPDLHFGLVRHCFVKEVTGRDAEGGVRWGVE